MNDRISISQSEGIADVRLDRADKLNALDPAMFRALNEVGTRLAQDTTTRCVVLSGNGRAFCAGLDFGSFQAMSQSDGGDGGGDGQGQQGPDALLDEALAASPANYAQRAAWVWQELPVPVLAAVHGVAYGGGLQVALGADIRFVHPEARLSVREIHWGLIPDMSGPQAMRHLLRRDVLKELTFTGRVVGGEEAVALGLATHCTETPLEDAMKLAREIAGRSPHAMRAAKQLLNAADGEELAAGLELEEHLQRGLMRSPNQVEAVRANFEKRQPKFADAG